MKKCTQKIKNKKILALNEKNSKINSSFSLFLIIIRQKKRCFERVYHLTWQIFLYLIRAKEGEETVF